MLKLAQIFQAQQRLQPYLAPSPLIYSDALSERSGARVWLKLECRQPTGSFKVRGALHKLMSLPAEARRNGIVTASAGNQALYCFAGHSRIFLYALTGFYRSTRQPA